MNPDREEKSWWVRAVDRLYGPYTRDQMVGYVAEGRIAARTQVAYGSDGLWRPAGDVPWLAQAMMAPRKDGEAPRGSADGAVRLLVWADLQGRGPVGAFEAALHGLGSAFPIAPGLHLLRTPATAARARNTLIQALGPGDRLLVIEAQPGRSAWYNLGVELETRFREAESFAAAND